MTYVKVRFAFQDWQQDGKSIYQTEHGIGLSMSDFHPGTVFEGELALDKYGESDLREALAGGCQPVFEVFAVGDHVPDTAQKVTPETRAELRDGPQTPAEIARKAAFNLFEYLTHLCQIPIGRKHEDAFRQYILAAITLAAKPPVEALQDFVDYFEQAGIGDCPVGHDDDGDDAFDGDSRFNVRQAREALAAFDPPHENEETQ